MSLSRFFAPELSVFRQPHASFGMLTPHLFGSHAASGFVVPKIDYITEKDQILINMEVPGVDKKDLDITIHGDTLTISGQVNRESNLDNKDSSYKFYERDFGAFSRSVHVPAGLTESDVKAKMENGILKIELPNKPVKPEAKRIEIA